MVHHRIPVPNMGFRNLLLEIARVYPRGREFTSKELAGRSRRLKRRPKYVSNALRRLFAMGLVKRHRRTRVCLPLRYYPETDLLGFVVIRRGVEYCYRLGERGGRYVEWLKKTQPMRDAARQQLQRDIKLGKMIRLLTLLEHESPRSKAPAGQPGFVDNPSAAVLAMAARNQQQQRENDQVQLGLFMHVLSEMKRAEQAEKIAFEVTLLVVVVRACSRSFDVDVYDKLVEVLAKAMPASSFAIASLRMNGEGKQPNPP
jgi:hypothetical protein